MLGTRPQLRPRGSLGPADDGLLHITLGGELHLCDTATGVDHTAAVQAQLVPGERWLPRTGSTGSPTLQAAAPLALRHRECDPLSQRDAHEVLAASFTMFTTGN